MAVGATKRQAETTVPTVGTDMVEVLLSPREVEATAVWAMQTPTMRKTAQLSLGTLLPGFNNGSSNRHRSSSSSSSKDMAASLEFLVATVLQEGMAAARLTTTAS